MVADNCEASSLASAIGAVVAPTCVKTSAMGSRTPSGGKGIFYEICVGTKRSQALGGVAWRDASKGVKPRRVVACQGSPRP